MISWVQILWQMGQLWSFLRHAYACGWSLYADVSDYGSRQRYAMVYAVAQVTPQPVIRRDRF
jgi:hypothetical protein